MAVVCDPAYYEDVKKIAKRNTWFRHVVHTGRFSQLVLMAIPAGEELGDELHDSADQIYFVVEGEGDAIVAGKARQANRNDVVAVRAGVRHNFRNTGREDLKLFAISAPAAYPEGTIHRTREDAVGAMVSGHG